MAHWKIPFPSIGDPAVSIPENLRKRGLLDIYVDVGMGKLRNEESDVHGQALPGGRYEVSGLCPLSLCGLLDRLKIYRQYSQNYITLSGLNSKRKFK